MVATLQEAKGEASFRLTHAAPESLCEVEWFESTGGRVRALRATNAASTEVKLLYRFEVGGEQSPRQILVLFDPMLSFALDAPHYYVAEMRDGRIAYATIWKREPSYAATKAVAAGLVDGSVRPATELEWPPGAREPILHAVDPSRLR